MSKALGIDLFEEKNASTKGHDRALLTIILYGEKKKGGHIMSEKIKVVGYTRVSTVIQAKEGESLTVQENAIKQYAKAYDYELVGIYKDAGVSGAKSDRPSLNKLRKDAEDGKFQKVIFKKLSRFGRNTTDLLNLYTEFENYKINLISIEEKFDTSTPAGQLTRTVLAAIAEFGRETIKSQMKEAKLSKLMRGECFLGREPYGYEFNKETKRMDVIDDEKNTYLKIVNMYLNQDQSMNDIALELNRSCKKSPHDKKWSTATLSSILKNHAYTGDLINNKYVNSISGNRIYEKDKNGKRKPKLKPEDEWKTFKIAPFISESNFQRIKNKIAVNSGKPNNVKYPNKFFAHRLIYCGECGGKLSIINGNERRNGTSPHYYRCHWAAASKRT